MRTRATAPLLTWLAAAGAMAVVYASLLLDQDAVEFLIREGGFFETVGALALLVATAFFLLAFRRSSGADGYGRIKRFSLLALALVLFLGAGEEVSWGQKIFEYPTPDQVREINAQEEFNFHNLNALDGVLDVTFLFKVFWATFAVLVPLACAVSFRVRGILGRLIPILPLWLAGLFVLNQLLAELASVLLSGSERFNGSYSLEHSRLEITECVVAVLFAVAAYVVHRGIPQRSGQPAPASMPIRTSAEESAVSGAEKEPHGS